MKTIELIFDSDCPNVRATRDALSRALTELGIDSSWSEWDRSLPSSPDYARVYGSPTILVDGVDVTGLRGGASGPACRVYRGEDGTPSGAPALADIRRALGG